MYLIAGLGNPGAEYENTRHNAGFCTLDKISPQIMAHFWKKECGCLTAKGTWHDLDVVLAKPQSFMKAYNIDCKHLIVIHDELEIPADSIRVKFGGGHAGHNGLRSICDKLCSRDWFRVRVGIGRPQTQMPVVKWVLSCPRGEDKQNFESSTEKAADAALFLVENGLEKTQNKFN